MNKDSIVWMIGGEAGYGIMTAGVLFAKTCARSGHHVFCNTEYPSLIRGGHNTFRATISNEKVHAQHEVIDILIALNKDTLEAHSDQVGKNGIVIYDGEEIKLRRKELRKNVNLISVPLMKLAGKYGTELLRNTVAIGASVALLDLDFVILRDLLRDKFKEKGAKLVNENLKAAKAAYDFVKDNYEEFSFSLQQEEDEEEEIVEKHPQIFITGNEAIAMGAVKAGCKFYSAYPMTPASHILHYMTEHELDTNMIVKQTEDEIAAINMAIGAGFTGVRSMTATSGGGFSLMVEGLGLAGITETPVVIVECQRPGPSTGLPTRTGQGDLKFLINASQGEFPRVVLAPGDVEECFFKTIDAFNLAEYYQLPVLILSDKYLSESAITAEPFDAGGIEINRGLIAQDSDLRRDKDFKRYAVTKTGISPRTLPGTKYGMFSTSGNEHNEIGLIVETKENRNKQMDKRLRKLQLLADKLPKPELTGTKNADVTLICWGSTKGPVKEAMKLFEKSGMEVNYLHILYLHPFPAERVAEIIENAEKTIVIEGNQSSQLSYLIKANTGLDVDHKILRYDGRPFNPTHLFNEIKHLAKLKAKKPKERVEIKKKTKPAVKKKKILRRPSRGLKAKKSRKSKKSKKAGKSRAGRKRKKSAKTRQKRKQTMKKKARAKKKKQ
ncbi:2-oxoacid:acceptor oxidoreductase subunit alpha, partial [Candidatus Woesearchaeota archaeon]|nr:2-oxoacid:acceptor oxidoreductase subunit alpha [Candidatus Woesearchaeota archaeon]